MKGNTKKCCGGKNGGKENTIKKMHRLWRNEAKKELIRVVKSPEGEISVDLTGKKSGRGAYICHCKECFLKAQKSKRLEKSFSTQISEEIYNQMLSEL